MVTLQPSPAAFPWGKDGGELRPAVGLPGGHPSQEPSGQTCCVNVLQAGQTQCVFLKGVL